MKYFTLLMIGCCLFGCKKETFQNDDIKDLQGDWNIVKVTNGASEETTLYDNLGTFTINSDGTGSMDLKSVDYSATGEAVKCIFIVQTIYGIDYTMDLWGLKKLDAAGKPIGYVCNDGTIHIKFVKLKKKEMVISLTDFSSLHPCVLFGSQFGLSGVYWYLEKK